ncbi:MAG: hypothetical protein AAF738_10810, partial [Bacteroidota bacterium]
MLLRLRYLFLFILALASHTFAQPANDLCTAATIIGCDTTISASTNTATFDKVDFCGTNNTAPGIWYQLAGTNEYITLSTCEVGTDFDSKISVFEGSCAALACVGGNDDDNSCGISARASTVGFQSVTGKTYFILVHGFARATGNFALHVQCGPAPTPPMNDVCTGAVAVNCGTVIQGSTIGATVDASITCGGQATEPGVWYTFPGNGDRFLVSVCDADYDTRLSIFRGPCSNLTCLTFNDDLCGLQSVSLIRSRPNETYYVLVHGANGESGNFVLDISCESMPANDDCSQAVALTCGTPELGSTVGGDLDNTPDCEGLNQTAPGVWYTFIGNGDIATLSTCSILSNFDTRLSVYTGNCGNFQCILENDDVACLFGNRLSELSFATTAGETYYVMVHGFDGFTGDFALELNCAPAPVAPANDLFA